MIVWAKERPRGKICVEKNVFFVSNSIISNAVGERAASFRKILKKNKKCAQPKQHAQKTQAPIVAKQTEIVRENCASKSWNLHFYQIQMTFRMRKKRYNYPL